MWWNQRRPEIVEDFEREVLGRVPPNVPKVTWTVTKTVNDKVGPYPVIARELIGHADNSAYPRITVDIQMVVVTPAWARKPVPVMMMFGRAALPSAPGAGGLRPICGHGRDRSARRRCNSSPPDGATRLLDPGSVQADNGAGLTKASSA